MQITRANWIVAVVVLFSSLLAAQECKCQFSSLYKNDGWEVPGLSGAVQRFPRALYKPLSDSGEEVFVTNLKPGDVPATILLIECSRAATGSTEVRSVPVEVQLLWKFELEGKTFAYRVVAGWLGPEEPAGERAHIGMASDLLFYDIDGSGKFKLAKENSSIRFAIEIPDWAKQKAPMR